MEVTRQEVARIAAEANVDARTVARALKEPKRTRSDVVRTAIHAALVKLGYAALAMTLEREAMHTPKRGAAPSGSKET